MKSFQVVFWLLIVLATVCLSEGRTRRDLRYRQNVAYAYQYRTDQIASVRKVPLVPVVVPSVHIQNQLLQHEKTKAHVLHFPTRRPMQAIDQLHTRVDIGQHRRSGTVPVVPVVVPVVPVVPAVATVPGGTVVAHSHTEVYRKYR
ncbi:uncharacterized protein LOC118513522 [Anopheles stephensi]|uniref:uncharacterized protein LOC118513522 n=1 Tax=Anopheles stephensi TaxID=30069 RepID=UPI0016587AEE|nr:uncharacterized protein LOC118513522 [Anopheles stephensi]